MQNFTKGMLIGGVIGMAGLTVAMSDKRTRRRMMKDGRRLMNKAESFVEKMDMM